jgi:hypothetical protein
MKRRIDDVLDEAFNGLRRLAPRFVEETPVHNKELFGVLSAIQRPCLPECLLNAEIECPEPAATDDEWTIVLAELDKIEAVADFLAHNERYELAETLSNMANEIKDALINQDGKLQ